MLQTLTKMKSLQNFSALNFPLLFISIVIFEFLIALPTSNCHTELHKLKAGSSSWTCGYISNIGYPSWGLGRPQYCGYPALMLDCGSNTSTEYPILNIGQESVHRVAYCVVAINKTNPVQTIKLRNELSEQSSSSLVFNQPLKEAVEAQTFTYGGGVERITCCTGNLTDVHHNHTVTFQTYPGDGFTAYFLPNLNSWSSVDVPVLGSDLGRVENRNETLTALFSDKCRESNSGLLNSLIIGAAISGSSICILGVLVICGLRKRSLSRTLAIFRKKNVRTCHNVDTFLKIYGSLPSSKRYPYASLRKMTNDFKDKLGEGGYASVYKGKLFDGRFVAVKVLKQSKGNGEDFINEVVSITKTNHVNVVALLGYCFEGKKRALIYEFMSNGSLEKYTNHGASKESLSWETQFNIAIGIARGLDYLHRGCNARILHFDIKPHNILLDEEFCPKISDFGLARLCLLQESTISMLEVRGTIGYIAPEVFCRNFGGVSNKSDVYSFGMMVLDMVCGRINLLADEQRSSQLYFPEWIFNQLKLGEEATFQGTANDEEKALQKKMIIVSLWCIQTYPSKRPSMGRVIEMLQGCVESIEELPMPYPSSTPRLSSETPTQTLLPSS